MITVQSLAVDLNNGVVETLKKAALSTAEDKQTWKPLDEGRSALDQIAECALITDFAAKMLIEKACPEFSNEAYGFKHHATLCEKLFQLPFDLHSFDADFFHLLLDPRSSVARSTT